MRKVKIYAVMLHLLLVFPLTAAWGKEYFLFDMEQNKILFMGPKDIAFTEKVNLEKNPDLMMQTGDPNKYLAILAPREEKTIKGKPQLDNSRSGLLVLFNFATGRTEDLVELGYAPFRWAYTSDHQHFFISYRPSLDANSLELMHYNISEQKVEKLERFAQFVFELNLTLKQDKLLALVADAISGPELQTISFNPLTVKNSLPAGNNPQHIYPLSSNRAALVDINLNSSQPRQPGSIKLIDLELNKVAEERKLIYANTYVQWLEKEHHLIVANNQYKADATGLTGRGQFFKVTAEGFRLYEIPQAWVDFKYFPERDLLYVLTDSDLKVINYRDSAIKSFSTDGANIFQKYFYRFSVLPDSNVAVIYCFENGNVKFYDLDQNKILKSVNCGRAEMKVANYLTLNGGKLTDTVVTTNEDKSRFFVLNRATKDITVFDQNFKRLDYIVPIEPPLAMYQIKKPQPQTLVLTAQKIYRIDSDLKLHSVFEFKQNVAPVFLKEEENRVILLTDLELLVLDPQNLEVKNRFFLFGDPGQKYNKLKANENRYRFIPAL